MDEPQPRDDIGQSQDDLYDDVERLRAWSQANADSFGGWWFNNEPAEAGLGSVRICIAVTAPEQDVRGQLAPLLDHPDRVDVIQCRWSYRDLQELTAQIAKRMPIGDPPRGTFITRCGPNIQANLVTVGIDPEDHDYAQMLLGEYGSDRIEVIQGCGVVPLS